jgi:hypothetical protein
MSGRQTIRTSEHYIFAEQEIPLGSKLKKSGDIFAQGRAQAQAEAAAQRERILNAVQNHMMNHMVSMVGPMMMSHGSGSQT